MPDNKHPIPEWVTRGKTITQLIEELQSFSNPNLEVRISLDYGDTHACISQVTLDRDNGDCCVLSNAEHYHENEWQDFQDEVPADDMDYPDGSQ